MGFDPRSWSSSADHRCYQTVTTNIDALLAENDSLRREIKSLNRQLDILIHQQNNQIYTDESKQHKQESTQSKTITFHHVERWGEVLSLQKGWGSLRLSELEVLIGELNRQSLFPQLNLLQRLDQLMPKLGTELFAATGVPLTKKRCAVHAAFALYGIRACEWLNEVPHRVVQDLRINHRGKQQSRRTRSDHRTTDRNQGSYSDFDGSCDPTRIKAFRVLGLENGASLLLIKQAHRRLVKLHHPDVGGCAESFHEINDAYHFLISQ